MDERVENFAKLLSLFYSTVCGCVWQGNNTNAIFGVMENCKQKSYCSTKFTLKATTFKFVESVQRTFFCHSQLALKALAQMKSTFR